jgi:FkbM family methyltransferase
MLKARFRRVSSPIGIRRRVKRFVQKRFLRLRTATNYLRFRWRTRRAPPTGFSLEIYKALNYSPASLRFMADAVASPTGGGVYESARLLFDGPFTPRDVILDVGGYTGDWAAQMRSRYDAFIHVFEPNPHQFEILRCHLSGDPKITLQRYGLGGNDSTERMSMAGMASSVYDDSPFDAAASDHQEIQLRDVKTVFQELGLDEVALLKINIEGGEYDLLDRLIAQELHTRCRHIRVQFHEWYEDAHWRRKRIVARLARTHEPEWSYPFVWESWRRKASA